MAGQIWRHGCFGVASIGAALLLAACAPTAVPKAPVGPASSYVQVDKNDIVNLADVRAIFFHIRTDKDLTQYANPFTITFGHVQTDQSFWIGYDTQAEARAAWRNILAAIINHPELVPIDDFNIVNISQVREISLHRRTDKDRDTYDAPFTLIVWHLQPKDAYIWFGYDTELEARLALDRLSVALRGRH